MQQLMISDYTLRQILDSRGNPTIEAEIVLENGTSAIASVPSGASTGAHEAVEKRDNDPKRFNGKSVELTIDTAVELLSDEIIGFNVFYQRGFDNLLRKIDGTEQKLSLGANVTLSLSLAASRAAAAALNVPLYRYLGGVNAHRLPIPLMNILNGGAHADNALDIQEFMIMPVGLTCFYDALRCGSEIYHALKKVLHNRKLSTNIGDEGGFAPNIATAEEAFELMNEAVQSAGYALGTDIVYALDVAATELYREGKYHIEGKSLSGPELIDFYQSLCSKYPIASIEDGAAEDDWETWIRLTETIGQTIQIVGDDLFVTNITRLQQGIDTYAGNAILIKTNQIGTLTETLDAISLAQRNGYNTIISHRSGETEDTFIADLAVAINAGQIKTGAPARTDRVAKYNQLLRIEEELGNASVYHAMV